MNFEQSDLTHSNERLQKRSLLCGLASNGLVKIFALVGITTAMMDVVDSNIVLGDETVGLEYDERKNIRNSAVSSDETVGLEWGEQENEQETVRSLRMKLEENGSLEVKEMEIKAKNVFGDYVHFGRSVEAIRKAQLIAKALKKSGVNISEVYEDAERLAGEKRSNEVVKVHIETHGKLRKIFTEQDIEIATRNLPRGWFQGEISDITITEKKGAMDGVYGVSKNEFVIMADYNFKAAAIVMYRDFFSGNKKEKIRMLYHEIGHANDWYSDNQMSRKQRLILLLGIHDRLHAKDRFRSVYVESIHNDNVQKQEFLRAKEYWAEICAQYFLEPQKLDVEDYALVDEVVTQSDPSYDPTKNMKSLKNLN